MLVGVTAYNAILDFLGAVSRRTSEEDKEGIDGTVVPACRHILPQLFVDRLEACCDEVQYQSARHRRARFCGVGRRHHTLIDVKREMVKLGEDSCVELPTLLYTPSASKSYRKTIRIVHRSCSATIPVVTQCRVQTNVPLFLRFAGNRLLVAS